MQGKTSYGYDKSGERGLFYVHVCELLISIYFSCILIIILIKNKLLKKSLLMKLKCKLSMNWQNRYTQCSVKFVIRNLARIE